MQALHDEDFLYLEMYMRCMISKITLEREREYNTISANDTHHATMTTAGRSKRSSVVQFAPDDGTRSKSMSALHSAGKRGNRFTVRGSVRMDKLKSLQFELADTLDKDQDDNAEPQDSKDGDAPSSRKLFNTQSERYSKAVLLLDSDNKDGEDGGHAGQRRRSSLHFDFLEALDEEDEDAKNVGNDMIAKAKWWHGIFFFSVIGFIACNITLWAKYPTGARVSRTFFCPFILFLHRCARSLSHHCM